MDGFKSDPFVVVTFGDTATRSHTQYRPSCIHSAIPTQSFCNTLTARF
jgi:hypothetical protein